MSMQIIKDSAGNSTGVFFPIKEWNRLKQKFNELKRLEEKHRNKEQFITEFKEALQELEQVEEGTLEARPIEKLLDEL